MFLAARMAAKSSYFLAACMASMLTMAVKRRKMAGKSFKKVGMASILKIAAKRLKMAGRRLKMAALKCF